MKFVKSLSIGLMFAVSLTACAGGEPPPSSFPGMAIDGPAGYLANNSHVYKFDVATGAERWRYPALNQTFENGLTHGPFAGEPLRFQKWVIVGGAIAQNGVADAHIYALDDATGALAWRWAVPGATESDRRDFADGVATDGKLLFAANGNGTLYALDTAGLDGGQPKIVWELKTKNKLWSRPLVAEGRIYQSSLDHTLYAVDAASGKPVWTFAAGASIASTPVIQNGVLFVGTFDGNFYALDAASGAVKWKSPVDAWVWTRATVTADTVYFGDTKGRFYALNATDGSRRYISNLGGTIHASPLIDDDSVYVVSTDGFIYVLPKNGTPDANGLVTLQRFSDTTLNRRLIASPAIVNGQLLLPLFDGDPKVTAFKLADRSKLFDMTMATATAPAPK